MVSPFPEIHTLIVLGAGASKVFEYPLGAELVESMIAQGRIAPAHEVEIKAVGDNLMQSRPSSIDFRLKTREDLAPAAKRMIARCLLGCESESALIHSRFSALYSKILEAYFRADEEQRKRIKIITFNYDRSFEIYARAFFQASLPPSRRAELTNLMNGIAPCHVFGRLPYLPEENILETDYVCEGYQFSSHPVERQAFLLGEAVKSIKTIHEAEGNTELVRMMNAAQRIYFIGMAYHPENMKLLGLQPDSESPVNMENKTDVAGSAVGFGNADLTALLQRYNFFKGRARIGQVDAERFFGEMRTLNLYSQS